MNTRYVLFCIGELRVSSWWCFLYLFAFRFFFVCRLSHLLRGGTTAILPPLSMKYDTKAAVDESSKETADRVAKWQTECVGSTFRCYSYHKLLRLPRKVLLSCFGFPAISFGSLLHLFQRVSFVFLSAVCQRICTASIGMYVVSYLP